MRKLIAFSIPCRNEEDNVVPLVEAIEEQCSLYLSEYDYLIQFIDNASTDRTREKIREICARDKKVRAIFNVANFPRSGFHNLMQIEGDCCILMVADFQDPPELIPQLVREWEKGAKVVCAIKTASHENPVMWRIRSLYYKIITCFSNVPQIPHFTGSGLYDRDFIEIIRKLEDPTPTIRGLVAEYGYRISKVPFVQSKRRSGKSNNDFFRLFDLAMRNVTIYTNIGIRAATFLGVLISAVSFIVGIVYLVLKLIFWDRFTAGTAPLLIGVFFLGSIQIFFIGMLGEYILSMNTRLMNRPYAVEEERINFDVDEEKDDSVDS